MKIQIDTVNKTIKLEEKINLKDLVKALDALFPNQKWEEFSLLPETITYWNNPIIIRDYPVFPEYPQYPWITCTCSDCKIEPFSVDFQAGGNV